MNTRVVEIVQGYSTKIKDGKAFFAPEIPTRKVRNAVKAYAPGVAENDVLVLVDDTVFGSAKTGALLTEDTLYVHNMFERPQSIALSDLRGVTVELDDYTTTMRVDDPGFSAHITLDEESIRQFAQMLKDMKAALHPSAMIGEKHAESELIVTVVPRAPRIALVRMVPIVEGKFRRFSFTNMFPHAGEFGTLENPRAGFFSHPRVRLELRANKVIARPDGKDVFVNDQPLLTEQELDDADRITLGKGGDKQDYQFQADPQLAKSRRRENEAAQGIVRRPPDFSGGDKPIRTLREQLTVTADGLCLQQHQGGGQVPWDQLAEILFIPDLGPVIGAGDVLGAASQGARLGIQTVESAAESERLSDRNAVFLSPEYTVRFVFSVQTVALDHVHHTACVLIDQAIEYYAPMDLVRFTAR